MIYADWLASETIFYNTKTNEVSTNINEVIDFESFDWHEEGLCNYLDFGYSVFEQTPIKNVKFLRHSSSISKDNKGNLVVKLNDDPTKKWVGKISHENDVLDLLEKKIRKWEDSVVGDIIIPTSGGYDSRLLNFMIKDKSRIRSFTYGISDKQDDSFEVVYAKNLSEILDIKWQQIQLGNFHAYLDNWYNSYGVSTHAHGMYHFEFYYKIRSFISESTPFLTGLIGDVWAGNVKSQQINNVFDLVKIGYTHGVNADFTKTSFYHKCNFELRKTFIENNIDYLKSELFQTVLTMRLKIILLNYLIKLPKNFDFEPFAPFIDIDIALGMLTLPNDRRKDRIWQKDFFRNLNLNIEDRKISCSYQNRLDFRAAHVYRLKPLSVKILSEVIDPEYVNWINKYIYSQGSRTFLMAKLSKLRGIKVMSKLAPEYPFKLQAYNAYMTLYPLQKIIECRNSYFKYGKV